MALNELTRSSVSITPDGRLRIVLPEHLDFEEDYESTASHLFCFRTAAKFPRRVATLAFHRISYISPSAALALASEVDRWKGRSTGNIKANVDSWQEDVKRLLADMGYFELLNLPHPVLPPRKDLVFLPFKRGDIAHKRGGGIAKALRREVEALIGFKINKAALFEGLSEAITNVSHHAYPEGHSHLLKPWWLSASYNQVSRELSVIFYDQGVGIPATLPNWYLFEKIKAAFSSWTDSEKIKAAMELGRTSTGKSHRGKGLRNFLDFATFYPPSHLAIFSGRGMFKINWARRDQTLASVDQRKDFQSPIGGTLIEWTVTLPK